MTPDRTHDLLPWFANGTLEPEEAAEFERHLTDCMDCKKELEFVEKLKAQIERHGADFLADHPSPAALLSVIKAEAADEQLSEDEAAKIRRHLALCVTCAEEASWIRDEATAGTAVAPPSKESFWRWVAVAAMVLLALTTSLWIRQASAPGPGVIDLVIIDETARAGTGRAEVEVAPGSSDIYLVFPLDLEAGDFPVSFEIVGSNGETRYEQDVARADLSGGYYLGIRLRGRDFPDGDYRARVSPSRDDTLAIEFAFRVTHSSR